MKTRVPANYVVVQPLLTKKKARKINKRDSLPSTDSSSHCCYADGGGGGGVRRGGCGVEEESDERNGGERKVGRHGWLG
ncbi:hypothetical protein ACLB2K_012719 [Fragaria x ananassa]